MLPLRFQISLLALMFIYTKRKSAVDNVITLQGTVKITVKINVEMLFENLCFREGKCSFSNAVGYNPVQNTEITAVGDPPQ
jgi:hypothetical protein